MITAIVSTIVVLGVLIFVHELGHFLVAKWVGVKVLRFSFGFGPRLVGITRGDTDYCISLVPLGGYVKMLGGEQGEEDVDEAEVERSFPAQSVSKRIAIVLAGPLSNFVFAIVTFALIFALAGIPRPTTDIGSVNAGSPAEAAGLLAGDKVLSINGKTLQSWDELSQTIEELGHAPLTVQVQRGTETLTFKVTPTHSEVKNIFGEPIRRPVMGVTSSGKFVTERVSVLDAVGSSFVQTWNLSRLFLLTVVKMFEGVVSVKTLGGPILIAQMAGQQAQEGLINLINFMALISVNLAVLNLLPVPVLDGGHILFFSIEAILRRPLATQKIELAQKVGMFILLALMILVFYNDIMRLLPGSKPDFLP